ncbi:MAG: hypothetical protein WC944_06205 [Candidatus Cloacimonadaceae bacterium]
MRCILCNSKTIVIRTIHIGEKTIRIRRCRKCGHEFSTEEKSNER